MGLEFQDAEMETMLRGVNQALGNYEALRKVDVPLDTEPAFSFRPGLPDRTPIKGPQRFETTIPKAGAVKAPANLEDVAFWPVTELAPSGCTRNPNGSLALPVTGYSLQHQIQQTWHY